MEANLTFFMKDWLIGQLVIVNWFCGFMVLGVVV